MDKFEKKDGRDPANRDSLTGEPGSHPVGTGMGSAGGAAAGVAVGAVVGGPVGAVVGGVAGAIAGGVVGHSAAEEVNPTLEGKYWQDNFQKRPYYRQGRAFEHYEPAYRHGWESAGNSSYKSRKFDEVEPELERRWSERSESSGMGWTEAREASRDAWSRVRGE
jgi:hypothetical protein